MEDAKKDMPSAPGPAMTVDALRAALLEGELSGPSTPFDFNYFLASKRISRAG